MKKIDTLNWKSVKISKLFDVVQETADNQAQRLLEGDIPLVSAGKTNNGIVKRIEKPVEGSRLFPVFTITVDMFGKAFLQTECFYAISHARVNMLIPKHERMRCKQIGLFLVSVISKKFEEISSYNSMCGKSRIQKETLLLPVDNNGHPDWVFMEDFMNKIHNTCDSRKSGLNKLQEITSNKLTVSDWQSFKLCDLFYKLELKCKKKDFNKSFDTSIEKTDEFSLPLVNAKHGNNGIMYYGRKTDFEYTEMSLDIVSNGAASTGDVYPQPHKTGVLYDAYLIKPKTSHLSASVLCFLAAVVQRCIKHKYGYDDKAVWSKVKNEQISLPVSENGEPDWEYMENYMREIESQCNDKLELLKSFM